MERIGNRFGPLVVEIVGFWTREYLEKKLAALRKANVENLIICVDAERGCSEGDLSIGARVLRFKRKIDPAAVLALANAR